MRTFPHAFFSGKRIEAKIGVWFWFTIFCFAWKFSKVSRPMIHTPQQEPSRNASVHMAQLISFGVTECQVAMHQTSNHLRCVRQFCWVWQWKIVCGGTKTVDLVWAHHHVKHDMKNLNFSATLLRNFPYLNKGKPIPSK